MRSAIAFLTAVGRSEAPGPTTLDWFPLVGALLGAALGGVWWAAGQAWTPAVAAAIVVALDFGLTGLLHLDGLVDSADGLLPPLDRHRRLEVMAAPDCGAFGVGAAGAVLLLRWAALASASRTRGFLLLAGLWCLSRTLIAVVARTQPYARPAGGLASAFSGPTRWPALAGGALAALALCAAWRIGPGLAGAGAAILSGTLVVVLARRRIGGYTGDVLGATAMVAETTGLLVGAARW
ncbi:MAG: adenosylcobinamide-GDP ribazoletransferase [Acidimicrobiales bacterium]|nr:adenosylcobinamide-GDP ribazoletransferase [Acidimicrobiales bacterium]